MGHDESVRRMAKLYIIEFMGDGKEHTKGAALAYATERFQRDGRHTVKTSVKRAVDQALGDTSAYVWLGYGRYQSKEAYLRTHDHASYAGRRITEVLGRAVKEIKDCYNTDLLDIGSADGDIFKVRKAANTVIAYLTECEKTINAALTYPESDAEIGSKPSVLGQIAASREERGASQDKPAPDKPKSRGPEL